ncbi:nicotinate-nucleotide--dimethylbenzimidazole phosphoribosyltransferase [uncultured Ruthenibacterium sp.]|uniref:nicotinate-nucleotide--dimethylbenzimidazole phosphoribosyltransferase n=1 Tax=uncultured Ruthenibacterium sp. TaxID=1905347 RepID=UPI00349E6384
MELYEFLKSIPPADEKARNEAHQHWMECAKPLGSLGLLETALEDIAALTKDAQIKLFPRAVLVLCADNGVVAQRVTQTDSSVTSAVAYNLAAGKTAVCRMAAVAKCTVVPVDFGIRDFVPVSGVLNRRVGNGTADITQGPAMTRAQAEQAIRNGVELVRQYAEKGIRLIATGEMGIGNTTTASAVASVLLHREPAQMTGRGAGLSNEGLKRKISAIENAIEKNRPDASDPVDVLAKVGGFDIAGMCGIFLGGAAFRIPVLIDGFISAVAALCATRLCPNATKAMLASHVSAEPAGSLLLQALEKRPLITAGMRLGEGTGAVAAIPLLDMAQAVYSECYTFEQSGIEAYTPQEGMDER